MDKRIPIVVFTGAGASRAEPIKLPTMKEFFQQIMDGNRNPIHGRITDKQFFKFVLDTLYEKNANYDLERIMGVLYDLKDFSKSDSWSILQHPNIYNSISKILAPAIANSSSSNRIDVLIEIKKSISTEQANYINKATSLTAELEDLIREKYFNINDNSIMIVYEPLFNLLINKLNSGENKKYSRVLPFFTTNYDMSIDWFFEPEDSICEKTQKSWIKKNNIEFINGFTNERNSKWDSQEYKIIDDNVNLYNNNTIFIPYYKLHGSLCWEKRAERIVKGSNIAKDSHINQELMIVYPSDKKVLHEEPYAYNQESLEKYIKQAEILLIIGFSFRDPGIEQCFYRALKDNNNLKVYIVNPKFEAKEFPELQRFVKHNKRVHHIQHYFGSSDLIDELEKTLFLE